MPRNRTKYQAKREHRLTAGEILDTCGPSAAAMKREANPAPSRRGRNRGRGVLTRWENIGRRVRVIRAEQRTDQTELEAA